LIRRFALFGVAMMLLLAGVSAYLRLSAAGLGCTPWPACYQQQAITPQHESHPIARLAHRVLASTLGIVVILIASATVAVRPRRPVVLSTSLALLVLTALLAALGRASATASSGIALANLLGGLAMLALLWWLALQFRREGASATLQPRWPVVALLVLLLAQILLGGVLSTGRSASECTSLPLCGSTVAGTAPLLHIAHRINAVALLIAAVAVAITARRWDARPLRLAWTFAVLLTIQIILGTAMVALDFPLWLGLAHHMGALLLLLVGVSLLAR
jgi:cytochrome c oxidase assembly protein subunit 15